MANIEIFHNGDSNGEDRKDCLGWITIMEKADVNLRTMLKANQLTLEERKKIVSGIEAGREYLIRKCAIWHYDRKLENYLLLGGVVKICDFGVVKDRDGKTSYRQLGYSRRGSKYRDYEALCKFYF